MLMTGFMALSLMACGETAEGAEQQQGGGSPYFWIIYIVIIGVFVYFMIIRPNKKQKKEQQDLFNSMAIGDSVLTTSGFYGVIIDLTDDTVIVEFGNNKNCRIPMQRAAIVQIEKPNYGEGVSEESINAKKEEEKKEKKSLFKKNKDAE